MNAPNFQAIQAIKGYAKFLWFENQVSLLLGKNYQILHYLFRLLSFLKIEESEAIVAAVKQATPELRDMTDSEVLKIVKLSKTKIMLKILEDSVDDLHRKYPNLKQLPEWLLECVEQDKRSFSPNVIKFLNQSTYTFTFLCIRV